LNTQKLSILIYHEDIDLFKEISTFFEKDRLQFTEAAGLEGLDEKLLEKQYDLLICLLKEFSSSFQESINTIKHEYSNLFIWVVSGSGFAETQSVDYHCSTESLKSNLFLKETAANLLHLAEKQKTQIELSAMLLHDLRSPVQNIFGYIELLEQGIFGDVSPGQKQILMNALSLGDTIVELMDDLGQAYQLEYRGLSFLRTAVSPKEAVDEILRSMWVQADKKNIKLLSKVSGNLPDIDGDYLSIQRIFHNLINNAVKISPQNGIVRISGSETETKNGRKMVSFQIQDSGPGIPPDELDSIFDKYYRVKKNDESSKGQGLGLYVARMLVSAHEGKIGAYNNREGGAVFYFTIPVYKKNK